ncbi:aspartic peptidase domain-containing protein [Plectosphaerella plurivora]|uniref:Aspartic peptidase domain-containing protein n=1 Tax=Plectosphaerella plurivora TaxID=936078 RepID=A0A9P8V9H1_9PEZI|nr:aspartic peptidase domain-containing protein [Plectosphaerella plurivora]
MKITILSLCVLHVLTHGVKAKAGFISLPVTRQTSSQALARRQADLIWNDYRGHGYMVDVDVGTPKQRVQLALGIESYGTTVVGKCASSRLPENAIECKKTGAYNASLSTSSLYVAEDGFDEIYEDDENALENLSYMRYQYYADDLTVEGQDTMKNVTFMVSKLSEAYIYGFLGLGFSINDSVTHDHESGILDDLTAQGIIGARAFGITLGGDYESSSLVLGGVDTKKFSGSLSKVPLVDPPQGLSDSAQDYHWLNVERAVLNSGNGTNTTVNGFKAATSSSLAYSDLPDDIVITVGEALGVTNWTDPFWREVPCTRGDAVNGSLELEFSGFTASIPYRDLLHPSDHPEAKEGGCYITVQPSWDLAGPPEYRLGSTFLRAMYAVFDQDSKAVWLAKYEDCGSEEVAFSKGEDVRGQCGGELSTSSGEGGSPNNNSGNGGSFIGVNGALMLGTVLVALFS